MSRCSRVSLAACALSVCLASSAHAQDRDPAAAQALFDQARSLMSAKQFDTACPRLEESQRLDPGVGTLFHLATCYEGQGRLATAWATFLEVASMAAAAGQYDRQKAATSRADALAARLPRLTIYVPVEARVPGLSVSRAETAVGAVQWGIAVPVNPGEQTVRASAPNCLPYTIPLMLKEGVATSVTIPALERVSAPPAIEEQPAPLVHSVQAAAPQPVPAHRNSPFPKPYRVGVLGLGSLGVVALGAGVGLGLLAKSRNDVSHRHCDAATDSLCSPHGLALRNQAFRLVHGATASFVISGASVAGATVLWLLGRRASRTESGRAVALLRTTGLHADAYGGGMTFTGSFR